MTYYLEESLCVKLLLCLCVKANLGSDTMISVGPQAPHDVITVVKFGDLQSVFW